MPRLNRLPTVPHINLQPACSKCSASMELAHTKPLKVHDEIEDRTYKCPKCGHSEAWVVKEL